MGTMTEPLASTTKRIPGGAFLISDAAPADCFFPEDFSEEQRQIAQTTADFATNEVLPAHDAIEAKDFAVTRRLIREASELGLTSVDIPEEWRFDNPVLGALFLNRHLLEQCFWSLSPV